MGCGVVGGGVVENLKKNADLIASRTGLRMEVCKVAVRDLSKARPVAVDLLTESWQEVVSHPDVDIVVELMGGIDQPLEVVLAAIEAGKPVVTANKALLAERGEEIFSKAADAGVPVFFEASVAGGIPIVKALSEGLRANQIEELHGIINGTCNYILTRMEAEGLDFETILKQAKELGYAEADESLDVDGIDAAHKAAILAGLAYGFVVPFDDVFVEGIREISPLDMEFAEKMGYTIKLLATIRPHAESRIEVRVNPALVSRKHVLASIHGVFNAVQVTGDVVGETLFYGRGAGADPTASAVLADVIEAALGLAGGSCRTAPVFNVGAATVLPMEEVVVPYYARLTVQNTPGVLAQVAAIFGKNEIGISSVFQPEGHVDPEVPLVLLLDQAKEADMQSALKEIKELDVVGSPCQLIRVEDLS